MLCAAFRCMATNISFYTWVSMSSPSNRTRASFQNYSYDSALQCFAPRKILACSAVIILVEVEIAHFQCSFCTVLEWNIQRPLRHVQDLHCTCSLRTASESSCPKNDDVDSNLCFRMLGERLLFLFPLLRYLLNKFLRHMWADGVGSDL